MKLAVHDILKIYFERKKLAAPSYSLRALARDLDLSPAYMSMILSGQRSLSESRLKDVIKILELDDIAILQLKNAFYPEMKTSDSTSSAKSRLTAEDIGFFDTYRPLDKKKYEILNDWYNIAIMDLTTCSDFVSNAEWIAKKLKIGQLQVEIAIDNLKRLGLLSDEDGKLKKVDDKLRFPTKNSQSVIRKFHKQMIKKAYEELEHKTEDQDFSKRLITGSTFALNSEHMEILKEKIQHALFEVAMLASQGDCKSVYQLNVQFFPLSKETA